MGLDNQGGRGVWRVVSQTASSPVVALSRRRSLVLARPALGFDEFFRTEFPAMVALARSICGDHQQAEDVAQEAMSRAHLHWGRVSGYDRPGAWLRRVTINLAISRRRRLVRELTTLRRVALQGRTAQGATVAGADGGEVGDPDRDVWAAVRQLPPRQRAVVALFYQEDLPARAIAEILGCSVSTATSHLNQARVRLGQIMGPGNDDEAVDR